MEVDDSNCEGGTDVMDMAENAEVNANDREPYCVPLEWQRVLRAWNDPSLGVGLEDSALSCGEFERPTVHHSEAGAASGSSGSTMEVHGGSLSVEPVEPVDGMSAATSASGSSVRPSSESAETGLKQTNLKGWLK